MFIKRNKVVIRPWDETHYKPINLEWFKENIHLSKIIKREIS